MIALLATARSVAAVADRLPRRSRRSRSRSPCVARALATVVATHVDIRDQRARARRTASDLDWVDHAARPGDRDRDPDSPQTGSALSALLEHVDPARVAARTAIPTDASARHGSGSDRAERSKTSTGDVLFHDYGTTGCFANATRVARHDHFTLWRPNGTPRLRLVIAGRFWDWLAHSERRLRAWPHPRSGRRSLAALGFASLPERWPKGTRGQTRSDTLRAAPGRAIEVVCRAAQRPSRPPLSAEHDLRSRRDFRRLSARLTGIVVSDAPSTLRGRSCAFGARSYTLTEPSARRARDGRPAILGTLLITGLCIAYVRLEDRPPANGACPRARRPRVLPRRRSRSSPLRSCRWRGAGSGCSLRAGSNERLWWLIRTYFVSYAAGQVLPTSLGGDAARIFAGSRRHPGRRGVAGSVLLERALGGAATLTLAAIGFVLAIGRYDVGPYSGSKAAFVVATVVGGVVLFSRSRTPPARAAVVPAARDAAARAPAANRLRRDPRLPSARPRCSPARSR